VRGGLGKKGQRKRGGSATGNKDAALYPVDLYPFGGALDWGGKMGGGRTKISQSKCHKKSPTENTQQKAVRQRSN